MGVGGLADLQAKGGGGTFRIAAEVVLVILDCLVLTTGYPGGGGAGGFPAGYTKGIGGAGPGVSHNDPGKSGYAGAGPGSPGSSGPGVPALVNSGSGGGGASSSSPRDGGAGGSGIILIAYPT